MYKREIPSTVVDGIFLSHPVEYDISNYYEGSEENQMIERIPPQNLDAEKSTLGAALLSKDALCDIIDIVRDSDFYSAAHKEIFATMVELHQNNGSVDLITVCEALKKRKTLEMVGGRAYLALLTAEAPSISNAAAYAKIIGEKASMRQLIKVADSIREKAFDFAGDPRFILDYAEKEIFEIGKNRYRNDYAHIKDVLVDNLAMIDEAIAHRGQIVGLTTGFKKFDELTGGLQKSNMIIVAARPAMGKTAFVLNIAQNAAIKARASVLICNLEMSKAELTQRLLSMEARVEMEKLKKGTLEKNDWDRIHLALDTLSKTNIHIDDSPSLNMLEMKNKCRRLKAEKGLDLIILDYLQLLNASGKSENRQQEISTMSRSLKLLAREMDCPIIVLSQLSREAEKRTNHVPMLSDLRESGAIEQDADMVILLYRDDYYNKDNSSKPGTCTVNLAKHRSGPVGEFDLAWIARYTKFSDITSIG